MRFAFNECGQWVGASSERKRKGQTYTCGCPDRTRVKLVKASGQPGKRKFDDYFAHVPDKSGCIPSCRVGGESEQHKMAKHLLRENYGQYSFDLFRCKTCKYSERFSCETGRVELEVVSRDGKWRYDCMVMKDEKPFMALEVYHRHKTDEAKQLASQVRVAEFVAEEVIRRNASGFLDNLLVEVSHCENCLHSIIKNGCMTAWNSERDKVLWWEQELEHNWFLWWCDLQFEKTLKSKYGRERAMCILKKYADNINLVRRGGGSYFLEGRKEYFLNGMVLDQEIYVGLISNQSFYVIQQTMAEAHSLGYRNRNIWFLNLDSVNTHYKSIKRHTTEMCDCKWPILKRIESERNICASCFKFGHKSDRCYSRKY